MPITVAADLVEALRRAHVLEPAQLQHVTADLQHRFPDSRALARELLQRGWLTAYQANLLLQDRGGELALGPYVLLERLGEGGMGQVFKARHQLMNRIVAIKVIRKERLADSAAVQRFHREIRVAAQLDHPQLVRAHDAAQVGDTHFLVMEYAEGTDLQRLVKKSGPLPVGQACTYIRQAALGLQYVTERGLVHRDIKPSNLQVTAQGATLKILDMGLARAQIVDGDQAGGAELTQARTMMGTPDYIAPEQITDAHRVDIRADLYSLGCTLYFLLAGRPPFPVSAWEEKLVCHKKVEPQPIEQLRPDVPAALGAVLRKMMAKRPEDRYATPGATAEALAPLCNLPASAASLVIPVQTHEAGWTLQSDSTIDPVPVPPVPVQSPAPPAGPTVLIPAQPAVTHAAPGQSTAVMPARPLSGLRLRLALVLAGGVALVGLGLLILVLILVWPKSSDTDGNTGDQQAKSTIGDTGKKTPIVARQNEETAKEQLKPDWPQVLIDEHFCKTYQNKLAIPNAWKGDAFRVVKGNDQCWLEVSKPTGDHFVTLPPLTLSGNFSIEGVYFMDRPEFANYHKLIISLENRKKSVLLPVVFDWAGKVLIANDARLPPQGYQPLLPTHFLLKREGNRLRVFLNKDPVADKDLDEVVEFDTLRLGLAAGPGNSGKLAKLYELKVAILPP
jgi:serine/threonine protein kinase